MNELLYPMIFKRKSFHVFKNTGTLKITSEELKDLLETFKTFKPLVEEIKVELKIEEKTGGVLGQEYCLALYSEVKEHYLENIGYLGQQLDLYCVSKNIGTLWFGLGKAENKQWNGLNYVIKIAIKKVDDETKFRKALFSAKRKSLEEIWQGDFYKSIGNIARFAPSSVNSQPWRVEAKKQQLKVTYNKVLISKLKYFNQIDMGIFLCFLELCLSHGKINFSRELYKDYYVYKVGQKDVHK